MLSLNVRRKKIDSEESFMYNLQDHLSTLIWREDMLLCEYGKLNHNSILSLRKFLYFSFSFVALYYNQFFVLYLEGLEREYKVLGKIDYELFKSVTHDLLENRGLVNMSKCLYFIFKRIDMFSNCQFSIQCVDEIRNYTNTILEKFKICITKLIITKKMKELRFTFFKTKYDKLFKLVFSNESILSNILSFISPMIIPIWNQLSRKNPYRLTNSYILDLQLESILNK